MNHSKVLVLEGRGWQNANGMDKKSKTFIRGIHIPYRRQAKSDIKLDETLTEKKNRFEEELVNVDKPEAHWRTTSWEDVRVGDLVKIRADEPLPGDIIICAGGVHRHTTSAYHGCSGSTMRMSPRYMQQLQRCLCTLAHK